MSLWIPVEELVPNPQDGDVLVTNGTVISAGVYMHGLQTWGMVNRANGRRSVHIVAGITHWQRMPALPGAKADAVEWPASRGTEHGQLMALQMAAEHDPNALP